MGLYRYYWQGLALKIGGQSSPYSLWSRQIAPNQRIHDRSESSFCLVGLIVKLTIAIVTRRLEALIRELILEAAVQVLVRQLYRNLMQPPRLETPRAMLVAAAE